MDHNQRGSTPVQSVVKRWAEAIEEIESHSTLSEDVIDRLTWLTFDSCYTTSEVRSWLTQRGQRLIGSAKPERFNPECHMIHRDGAADKLGEWKSLLNSNTEEVVTYHYDAARGVGKKHCIS